MTAAGVHPRARICQASPGADELGAAAAAESVADVPGLLPLELARRLCDTSPLGILLSDAAGVCLYANTACQHITGLTRNQTRGKPWAGWLHPQDRPHDWTRWLETVCHDRSLRPEVRICRPDGSIVWTRLHATSSPAGITGNTYLLMIEDVTERKAAEQVLREAEEALFREKERAEVTLASIGDAVLVTDLADKVTYLNPEAERLTGWSREAAAGRPLEEVFRIVDRDSLRTVRNPAKTALDEDRTVGLELGCLLVGRDGTTVAIEDSAAPVRNRDGSLAGAVIVFHDAARAQTVTERNAHLATHDSLTGLANAALLTERLSHAIALARRHRSRFALLFVDLDRFKTVNDTHGHLIGDELLKAVARRLEGCVRATDTVCRRGGDEFVILLAEIDCRQDAAQVAEKILAALCEPYVIDEIGAYVSASIGIAVYPDDGEEASVLLRCADAAMYKAKAGDRGELSPAGWTVHW